MATPYLQFWEEEVSSTQDVARSRLAPTDKSDQFRTRGPLSYAGPGSLGGTESALRR